MELLEAEAGRHRHLGGLYIIRRARSTSGQRGQLSPVGHLAAPIYSL